VSNVASRHAGINAGPVLGAQYAPDAEGPTAETPLRVGDSPTKRLSHQAQSPKYGPIVSLLLVRESGMVQHVDLGNPQPEVIWLVAELLGHSRFARSSIRINPHFRPSLTMQNLLQALADSERHLTGDEAAVSAGYSPSSKVRVALSAMRKAGLITNVSGCGYAIAEAGLALLTDLKPHKPR
jgi:hypothetical protein